MEVYHVSTVVVDSPGGEGAEEAAPDPQVHELLSPHHPKNSQRL